MAEPREQRDVGGDIPARLDRLPWTRFHTLLVVALGITWVLDGLEVTIVSAVGNALLRRTTLGLTEGQLGLSHTLYLFGAIGGALVFGHLADRLGRKKLFTVTLLIYLVGAALTACAWDFLSFALFRFVIGTAIGGEYAAVNSAIDELIPARVRGRVDLAVNGTFWLGAILGAGASVVLLDPAYFPRTWAGAWRSGWGAGVGLGMIVARQFVPESPRWLLTHGRGEEAEQVMAEIERHAVGHAVPAPEPPAEGGNGHPASRAVGVRDDRPYDAGALPEPGGARAGADRLAGVLLQRGVVQLSPGAAALLWGAGQPRGALRPGDGGRQLTGPIGAGDPVRHRGPANDDWVPPTPCPPSCWAWGKCCSSRVS